VRIVTEFLLPGLVCPCCGEVTFAGPPPGLHPGTVSYGPVLNAAAVLLTAYGNVPAERSAQLIGMILGADVSAGWVDKAVARVSARLRDAGFDEAMMAALAAEDVLAADETPVNVLDKAPLPVPEPGPDGAGEADPEGKDGKAQQAGAPHVIRRDRQVMKLGPGRVQDWAGDVIEVLGEAYRAVEDARSRGSTSLDPQVLGDLRERYDSAVSFGMIHNRLRDWNGGGNHPGYALACWLRDYKEQVFLFTRHFSVGFTNNVSERGAKAAKRHEAVSGYWHNLASTTASHQLTPIPGTP
jgi:transposase